MTVQVFSPQISVILRKNIGRATVAPKLMSSKTMELNSRDVPKVTSSESTSHTVAAA